MSKTRDIGRGKRRRKTLWAALLISAVCHPLGLALFEWSRKPSDPRIFIGIAGKDYGQVDVPNLTLCDENCTLSVKNGSKVRLVAMPTEDSVFEGWDGPCGSQRDQLYEWVDGVVGHLDANGDALQQLMLLGKNNEKQNLDPKICDIEVNHSVVVNAVFRSLVEDPKVAWLPKDKAPPKEPSQEKKKSKEVTKTKDNDKKTELKLVPEKKIERMVKLEKLNLKSVSVPDENEVDKSPNDAQFLSDKDRDVEKETRTLDTNLDMQSKGEDQASSSSDLESEQVGGENLVIAETEDVESDADKDTSSRLSDNDSKQKPGMLSMRGLKGQGDFQSKLKDKSGVGQSSSFDPRSNLSLEDYERIVGTKRFSKESTKGRKKRSTRVGRHNARMKAFRSTLETFTPEVEVGNQTALKTRASPFALYLDVMHREIHKRWGFGYLVRQGHKFPDTTLWGKLEIVIKKNGEIDNIKFAKSSGNGIFDAAAWSVMDKSGPFPPPPKAIRSPNSKTYIHWRFHRDGRQCGTFGATPFILNEKK